MSKLHCGKDLCRRAFITPIYSVERQDRVSRVRSLGRPAKSQPYIAEALESRLLFSLTFPMPSPYGNPTVTNGRDVRTGDVPLYLTFAGGPSAQYGTDGSVTQQQLKTAVLNIINSSYLSELAQYGVTTKVHFAGSYVSNYALPANMMFNAPDDVRQIVETSLNDGGGTLPEVDDTSTDGVYFVFTPEGYTSSDVPESLGYHTNLDTGLRVLDPDNADIGVVMSRADSGMSALDGMSSTFSHELVELLSDPEGSGGVQAFPSASYLKYDNDAGDELCDSRARYYFGYESGTMVQSYWSAKISEFDIPGATLQTSGSNVNNVFLDQTSGGPQTITLTQTVDGGVVLTSGTESVEVMPDGAGLSLSFVGNDNVTIAGNFNLKSGWKFDFSGEAPWIPGSLGITGSLTLSEGSDLGIADASVNGRGVLTNSLGSTLTLVDTRINTPLVNRGLLMVPDGTNINAITNSFTTAVGSNITLNGNINTETYAYLDITNGFTNNGTITLDSIDNQVTALLYVDNGKLVNAPGAVITGTGQGEIYASINNVGLINVPGGQLFLGYSVDSSSGTIAVAAGATLLLGQNGVLTLGKNVTGAGSITSPTINLASAFILSKGGPNLNFGTVNGPGVLTNSLGNTLILSGWTIIDAPFVNLGSLVVPGSGDISTIGGSFATGIGSTITLNGNTNTATYAYLEVKTGFTNNGTITLKTIDNSTTAELVIDNGTLVNAPGANITAAGTGAAYIGASTINSGTLNVSAALALYSFTQLVTGTYDVVLPSPGMTVTGRATLSGGLNISGSTNFQAVGGTTWPVMNYGSWAGSFTALNVMLGGIDTVNAVNYAASFASVKLIATAKLSFPLAVKAVPLSNRIVVNWTANPANINVRGVGYDVYRSTSPVTELSAGKLLNSTPISTLSYTDTTAVDGTKYYYEVVARSGNSLSSPSNEASATPVSPQVSTKLVFGSEPTSGSTGIALSPQIIVYVEDASGKIVTSDASTITITIASGPKGGKLAGTVTVKAVNGVARFSGIMLNIPGSYTLRAIDGILTMALSKTLVVERV